MSFFKRDGDAQSGTATYRGPGYAGPPPDEPRHPVTTLLFWGSVVGVGLALGAVGFLVFLASVR